jgi:hypothetical protein
MSGFRSPIMDLGRGFSVEFTFANGAMSCEWSPDVPHGKRARQISQAYFDARHRFLSRIAQELGTTIAVVDLPAGSAVSNG